VLELWGGFWKNANNGKIFKYNDLSPIDYFPEFFRVLKDGTHCYVMTNNINLIEMLNVATECGFKFIKSLIWNKGNKICGRFYMNCFEYILMFRKGTSRDINNCSTPDILEIPIKKLKDNNGNNLHETEKPVELMKILIQNSTNEGEMVLEPFAGIGSTLIACDQLNRKCVSSEIDLHYAEIIKNRFTGSNEKSDMLF
jgi:site-specific DNA-methyltransferase (adenine-specific)